MYGFAIFSLVGAMSYYYIWRKRMKNTDFQNYLIDLNNLIQNKINKNKNPYLSALFMSFSEDAVEQRKEFQKVRERKLKQKQMQSDPLLPPFEKGVYITDISPTHCILFDSDPVLKGQMLITTKDFEYQNLLLTPKDFEACLRFIKATEGFVIYRSNEKVGTKFNHRHILGCLYNEYLPLIETYKREIDHRRKNFNKYSEPIHAKVNELVNFEHALVSFEPITLHRKEISLNPQNMRERAKHIHKLYLEYMNRLKMLKKAYKATYVLLMTEDYLLLVKEPQRNFRVGKFDPFIFAGKGKLVEQN